MTRFIIDKNVQILGLRDRDDLANAEIIRIDYLKKGIRVLPFRTIEHCFVQPDVLRKFYEEHQLIFIKIVHMSMFISVFSVFVHENAH